MSDMNQTPVSLGDFFDSNEHALVIIPIIQRDYAQGRKDKGYIRKEFLKSIYKAVTDSKVERTLLDFIYGFCDKNDNNTTVFYPLDGQQRLTTLWLLYWYLAVYAEELQNEEKHLSTFTYETRISSRDFCKELCKAENMKSFDTKKDMSIVDFIIDQHWFFSDWQKDPTISSMLRTIGGDAEDDGIEPFFNKKEKKLPYKDLLKNLKEKVFFYKLVITEDKLPLGPANQLYIKMNARGKFLSDFENFRADLINQLDKLHQKDPTGHDPLDISKKIDYDWSDVFWKYLNKSLNSLDDNSPNDAEAKENFDKVIGRNTDELLFAFINRFCFGQLCVAKDSSQGSDYLLKPSDVSLIDAIQDEEAEKKLTSQRKIDRLSSMTEAEEKLLLQYDYLFNDEYASYENYDLYKGILPFTSQSQNEKGNYYSFSSLKHVLDGLTTKTNCNNRLWAEFIQEQLDEIVNERLKIREPNAEGYRFLPEYKRKYIEKDKKYVPGNFLTRSNKGGSIVGQINGIQLKDRIYFFAICKYLDKNFIDKNCNNLHEEHFVDWLYFCRNVIENANISSVTAMINCMRDLEEYGEGSGNILGYLCGKDTINTDYTILSNREAQIAEEKQKASRIMRNYISKGEIRNAENYSCFCGCIRFLFLNGSFEEDWANYNKRWKNIQGIFHKDKNADGVNVSKVLEYVRQYKSFEEASEKYIFHCQGWKARGDSWLSVLCDKDCREKVDLWLKGVADNKADKAYALFVNSKQAIKSVVTKDIELLKGKSDFRITRKGNHWVCAKKYSEYDILVFDDDTFKRNKNLTSLLSKGYITIDNDKDQNAKDCCVGDSYYWYKDIFFKDNNSDNIYIYNSNGVILELNGNDKTEISYDTL